MPERVVPAVAHLHETLQLGIDAPGIDLAAELGRLQGVGGGEVRQLLRLAFELFGERVGVGIGGKEDIIGHIAALRRFVRAEVLLSPGFHPLHLLRPCAEDDPAPAEAFIEDRPLLRRDKRLVVVPLSRFQVSDPVDQRDDEDDHADGQE